MASVDRVQAVSPANLSASLPHVRLDPDREPHSPHRDGEEPEEAHDVLELHAEESAPVPEALMPVSLIEYDGLDLSA